MSLELVFECPQTIGKLRIGPLGKLLDGFCGWLLECGFSRSTIRNHLSNVSHLNNYLDAQKTADWQTLSSEDINGFFKEYPLHVRIRGPSDKDLHRVQWSVNRFVQYLWLLKFFNPSAEPAIYQPLLDKYLEWMRHYQHAARPRFDVIRSANCSNGLDRRQRPKACQN